MHTTFPGKAALSCLLLALCHIFLFYSSLMRPMSCESYIYICAPFWPLACCVVKLRGLATQPSKCSKMLVMINFMCQLSLSMVPRYVAKHYSKCFYDNVLDEINI